VTKEGTLFLGETCERRERSLSLKVGMRGDGVATWYAIKKGDEVQRGKKKTLSLFSHHFRRERENGKEEKDEGSTAEMVHHAWGGGKSRDPASCHASTTCRGKLRR